jgi:hypothetical protein
MQSLQELRSLQKPDTKIEEILAAVIIIRKSFFNESMKSMQILSKLNFQ